MTLVSLNGTKMITPEINKLLNNCCWYLIVAGICFNDFITTAGHNSCL